MKFYFQNANTNSFDATMRGPVNPFTTSLAKGDEDSVLGLSFPNWLAAQMRGKEGEFQDYLVFHVKVWKDKPIVVDKALKKMRSETSRKEARLASPPFSSSEAASRQDDRAPDHTAATASLTSPSTSRTSSCSSSMATPAPPRTPKTTPPSSSGKKMRKKRGQKRKSSLTQRGTPRLRAKPAEETQRVPGFPAR